MKNEKSQFRLSGKDLNNKWGGKGRKIEIKSIGHVRNFRGEV